MTVEKIPRTTLMGLDREALLEHVADLQEALKAARLAEQDALAETRALRAAGIVLPTDKSARSDRLVAAEEYNATLQEWLDANTSLLEMAEERLADLTARFEALIQTPNDSDEALRRNRISAAMRNRSGSHGGRPPVFSDEAMVEIARRHFVGGESISAIARATGASRATVRRAAETGRELAPVKALLDDPHRTRAELAEVRKTLAAARRT